MLFRNAQELEAVRQLYPCGFVKTCVLAPAPESEQEAEECKRVRKTGNLDVEVSWYIAPDELACLSKKLEKTNFACLENAWGGAAKDSTADPGCARCAGPDCARCMPPNACP